jgi:hypothetical protein
MIRRHDYGTLIEHWNRPVVVVADDADYAH